MDNATTSSGMDLPWLTYFQFTPAWVYFFETAGRVSWRDLVCHLFTVQHLESHWRRSQAGKKAWCQIKTLTIDEKKNPPTMSPRFHLFVGGGAQRRSLKRRTRTTGTATTTNTAPPCGAIRNTNTKNRYNKKLKKCKKQHNDVCLILHHSLAQQKTEAPLSLEFLKVTFTKSLLEMSHKH